ncbi:hypothetical protein D3C84_575030 [compost metagenome]
MQHHVGPADIGLQVGIAGGFIELRTGMVECRHAGVAAAGDVQRGQVQRQAHQVVAQGLGDELVDLVAHGTGQAAHYGARRFLGGRAAGGEGQGVEEGGDQADLLIIGRVQRVDRHRVEVGVKAVDRLGQHRVAETVNRVGELGDDGWIDGGVVAGGGQELVHHRLDGAGELLEHQVLVLHLCAEFGGLEQPLAVPLQGIDRGRRGRERGRRGTRHQPGRQFGQVA